MFKDEFYIFLSGNFHRSNPWHVEDGAQNWNSPMKISYYSVKIQELYKDENLVKPEEVDGNRKEATEENNKPIEFNTHANERPS